MTLKNGLTLALTPFPKIKTVTLHAWVGVGSSYEPKNINGISHFLEHMLFRGNEFLGDSNQLNLNMEELGGEINAATSFDHTEYWLEFHCKFLETGIKRFIQFLRFPSFEKIELERSIILEELKSSYNEENQIIDVDSLTLETFWPEEAFGFPVAGIPESIKAITLEDLRDWYKRYYQASNMVIGITGDFDLAQIQDLIETETTSLEAGEKQPYPKPTWDLPCKKPLNFVQERDNQYQFQWSFPFPDLTPKKRMLLQLALRMLDDGSSTRMQRLIREEKGLAYDISASPFFFSTGGLMQIQGIAGLDKINELVSELAEIVKGICNQGFNENEFNLARLRFQTSLDCFSDNAEGLLLEAVSPLIHPGAMNIDQLQEALESVTLEEINSVTREAFAIKTSQFVLLGPEDKEIQEHATKALADWVTL